MLYIVYSANIIANIGILSEDKRAKYLAPGIFPWLMYWEEVCVTQVDRMETQKAFFWSHCMVNNRWTSMESTRFTLHQDEEKAQSQSLLPPTSIHLFQHMLRTNLLVTLWRAVDRQAPPEESTDITQFG